MRAGWILALAVLVPMAACSSRVADGESSATTIAQEADADGDGPGNGPGTGSATDQDSGDVSTTSSESDADEEDAAEVSSADVGDAESGETTGIKFDSPPDTGWEEDGDDEGGCFDQTAFLEDVPMGPPPWGEPIDPCLAMLNGCCVNYGVEMWVGDQPYWENGDCDDPNSGWVVEEFVDDQTLIVLLCPEVCEAWGNDPESVSVLAYCIWPE